MSEDALTLEPTKYDKIGVVHCGVTREGFVTAGGKVQNIEDGADVTFEHVGIKVSRKGSEYNFSKT